MSRATRLRKKAQQRAAKLNNQSTTDKETDNSSKSQDKKTERAEIERTIINYSKARKILLILGYLAAIFLLKIVHPVKYFFDGEVPTIKDWTALAQCEVCLLVFWAIPAIWLWRQQQLLEVKKRECNEQLELINIANHSNNGHNEHRVEIEKTRQNLHRLMHNNEKFLLLQSKLRESADNISMSEALFNANKSMRSPLINGSEELSDDHSLPRWTKLFLDARNCLYEVKAELAQEFHAQEERSNINWLASSIFVIHFVLFIATIITMYVLNGASGDIKVASQQPAAESRAAYSRFGITGPVLPAVPSQPRQKEESAAGGQEQALGSSGQVAESPSRNAQARADAVVPVLQIPIYVLLYSWIGSLLAMLWRVLRGPRHSESTRELSWFLARPVMGVGMGIVTYLILVIALSTTTIGSAEFKKELIYLATLLVALTDGPWVSLVRWGLSRIPGAEKKNAARLNSQGPTEAKRQELRPTQATAEPKSSSASVIAPPAPPVESPSSPPKRG